MAESEQALLTKYTPWQLEGNDKCRATQLHSVIQRHDVDWTTVSNLIDSGCSVNTLDGKSFTPLHYAIVQPNSPLDIILKMCSPENIYTKYKIYYVIQIAIKKERWDIVDALIETGFALSKNKKKKLLNCKIALADKQVPLSVKRDLIAQYSHKINTKMWKQIMNKSLKNNCWDIVPHCINMGSSAKTAILEVVTILLTFLHRIYFALSPKYRDGYSILRYEDSKGRTLLNVALEQHNWEVAEFIIKLDNDVINITDVFNMTPLMYASSMTCVPSSIVMRLISDTNINNRRNNDTLGSALHIAVSEGNWTVLDALVSKGAALNVRDKWGRTPLILYCEKWYPFGTMAKLVAPYCIDDLSRMKDKVHSTTALHNVVKMKNWEAVRMLIEKGGNKFLLALIS